MANATRATFSTWLDRGLAAILLLFGLAGGRSWLSGQPWEIARWTALFAGAAIGLSAGRLIASRLAYHAYDGPIAADALRASTRRRYIASWHALGLAAVLVITVIARPTLLSASLSGYLIGAVLAQGTSGLGMPGFAGMGPFGRIIRSWPQGRHAGAIGAAILMLLLAWLARVVESDTLVAIAGLATAAIAWGLTAVDAGIVRFRTISGHGSWRIFADQAQGILLFAAVTVPICWLAFAPAVAGIVALVSAAVLLLMALRVLVYRLHAKRFADLLVTIVVGLLVAIGFAMSFILPVAAIVIFWQLQRRAAHRSWLVA